MISDKISKIMRKCRRAVLFDGVVKAKVDFAGAMLKNAGGTEVPADYVEFLEKSNGMIEAPYEFYGTEVHKRNAAMYNFPNIVDANMDLLKDGKNPFVLRRIIIGQSYFDLIIFDEVDAKYKIVNRLNFSVVKEFKSFEMLLDFVIASL